MPEISAAAVKALRDQTGLPMMDCKKALQESGGDAEAATEWLRKHGKTKMEGRTDRATEAGRVAVFTDDDVAAMVEVKCESAPVAANEEFIQLADGLARQLATGPGAAAPEELLAQPSPSKPGKTLREQFDDLTNRIREVLKVGRMVRVEGTCGGYGHHTGSPGVLVQYEGGSRDLAREICMHVAAMRPAVVGKEDLDPALVQKERDIQAEIARGEGKPENIIVKMIEGRMKNFYAQYCLLEQPYVKDDSQTVAKVAQAGGLKVVAFHRWELGEQ